jgi:hypothetical protein
MKVTQEQHDRFAALLALIFDGEDQKFVCEYARSGNYYRRGPYGLIQPAYWPPGKYEAVLAIWDEVYGDGSEET